MFEHVWSDCRLAARTLRRSPRFTATAVLTLALGLGSATAMFALVEGVLLRPLPIRDERQVVLAWRQAPTGGPSHLPFTWDQIDSIARGNSAFESVAGVGHSAPAPGVAVDGDAATYIQTSWVTGDFFRVLGVAPLLGRTLTRADDVSGTENVLVISAGLWRRQYGATADTIGRRIVINAQPFTIVGIMPPDVEYPSGTEAWFTTAAGQRSEANPIFRQAVRSELGVVARLRTGVTYQQAAAELRRLMRQWDLEAEPGTQQGLAPDVRPFRDVVVRDVRASLIALFGAVLVVLVIATSNIANLVLLRGDARRIELAIRTSLGATRGRLVRLLVAESTMLATAAAVGALSVTWTVIRALPWLAPEGLPRIDVVRIDRGVVLFTATLVLMTVVLAGLAPAMALAGRQLAATLRSGAATLTAKRRASRALVVVQVALAVIIVAAASLLARSLLRLQAVDAGLPFDRLVSVRVSLPPALDADRDRHLQFLERAIQQLESAPGIVGATPVNMPPFSGSVGWDVPVFTAEGQDLDDVKANPSLNLEAIHPNYFRTFAVPIVRGRAFTDDDRRPPEVAIVSEELAERMWPGQDPIGKRLKFGNPAHREPWRTVVGVARPTRYRELQLQRATVYLPAAQFIVSAQILVLRTSLPDGNVSALARERLREVDPNVRVMRVAPFSELLAAPLAMPRFNASLSGGFGSTALFLTAMGLYGIIASSVRQRHREIGIRVAVGATAGDIRRLVLTEGLALVGLGAAIGLAATIAGAGALRGLLFEVAPLDPASLAAAVMLLLACCVVAVYVPARAAMRIDVVAALLNRR